MKFSILGKYMGVIEKIGGYNSSLKTLILFVKI